MQLTPLQEDGLVELLNIGFGRAAAPLSQLTGHRVLLDVPEVSVHQIEEVGEARGGHHITVRHTKQDQVARDGQLGRRCEKHLRGFVRRRVCVRNQLPLGRHIWRSEHHFVHEHVNALGIPNECLGIASVPGEHH
jgi:hypothetical protein